MLQQSVLVLKSSGKLPTHGADREEKRVGQMKGMGDNTWTRLCRNPGWMKRHKERERVKKKCRKAASAQTLPTKPSLSSGMRGNRNRSTGQVWGPRECRFNSMQMGSVNKELQWQPVSAFKCGKPQTQGQILHSTHPTSLCTVPDLLRENHKLP